MQTHDLEIGEISGTIDWKRGRVFANMEGLLQRVVTRLQKARVAVPMWASSLTGEPFHGYFEPVTAGSKAASGGKT